VPEAPRPRNAILTGMRASPGITKAWRAVVVAGAILGAGCGPLPGGSHHADLHGVRIAYRVHGHGPRLLLLHGGGGQALGLVRQILDFGRHFTVIAPDSRGHGGSTDDGDTLSYHVMAEDMVALMDRLRIGRADVVGWSDGGIIGLDLAIHHPDRVRKLVVFGANFTPEGVSPGTLAWLRQAWAEDSAAAAADLSESLPFDARLRRLWLTQPNFTPAQLRSIQAPTLVAVGDHDLPRIDHTLELVRAIPGAQLCVIPGATHAVLHERADLADEIVLQFLRARIHEPRPSSQL
jgi:pimeloyl-ACP methyl ester carboxylesterase